MLNKIFNPDNFIFRGCGKLVDLVVLSLLWLVCCLPVITIGPATAALYYAVVKCVRRGEERPYYNFYRCFRDNFKVGTLTTLLILPFGVFLAWGRWVLIQLANAGDETALMIYFTYSILIIVCTGVAGYLFPVLSRFTYGVGGLISITFKLALRSLPTTVILGMLLLEAVELCLQYWTFYFIFLIVPAVAALLASLFLERIFKKITPAENLPEPEDGEEADIPWYLK